ncbi:MAG: Zn-ribbon domain-containing OB-fold protein [Deltaproteobacteria bacterium]|nr:Zn-ribbon domain-containing OB-fold protein [Deltaproteobacteria bacterium]
MITSDQAQPFNYAVGLYGSKFFQELKDNRRIVGSKCHKCGKVYVPPRKVCGGCFCENTEFVEVGPQGTIGTYTIVRYTFIDPETGKQKPVPYGYGFIRFDGADTLFQHFVELSDDRPLKIGARVEPVFADVMKGTIRDILYFRIID